jgi:HD-GYP domain-containing protein (c-di-GMP phosphodiesterase class II)
MMDFHSPAFRFFNFWSPSLGRRLTISFTVFGLVISYFSVIYLTIASTTTVIRATAHLIRQQIMALSQTDPEGDILLKIINHKRDDITAATRLIQGFSPNLNFDLYYANTGGKWRHIYAAPDGAYRSETVSDPVRKRSLERARHDKIVTSSPLFYGREDNVHVDVDISMKDGRNAYILSFNVNRPGILTIIRNSLGKFFLFTIIILILSHIIGHLISFWLARPIIKLSREAAFIASGHYNHWFRVTENDEIGILAESLNKMSFRLIASAKEREALLIGILIALTRAIDAKSPWTAGHSERVTRYAEEIGRLLELDEEQMRILTISAILHDIGKIAIPEQILDKPGKLSDEEFNEIKKHPPSGTKIISSIPSYEAILSGILYHHERWDGTGYPEGLKEKDIPLYARIISVADVYDALTADRPYRKAWSREETMLFFEEQKEKMFDPELVEIFKTTPSQTG